MKQLWQKMYIKRPGLLPSALGLMAFFALPSVQAVTCEFTKVYTESVTNPVIGSGMATAGEDAPVGKILYRQEIFRNDTLDTKYVCNVTAQDVPSGGTMHAYTRTEVISSPSGAATTVNGKDVFPTNVPGIGVIFYISGPTQNISHFPNLWEVTYPLAAGEIGQNMGQLTRVTTEFIKTGPIPPGVQQISGASLPTFQVTSGSNSPFPVSNVFVRLNFSGNTIIHTKTCHLTTSEIDVNLGSHWLTSFSGPGSVTPWKNFDIVLQDCPPFYGYNQVTSIESLNLIYENNEKNTVKVDFRSSNGVVQGNPLLAKINNGPNAAEGVGIEMSQRDVAESIPLDGSGSLSLLNLSQESNSTYTIPLKARYVQTETTVKPGLANGSVVFTITYL